MWWLGVLSSVDVSSLVCAGLSAVCVSAPFDLASEMLRGKLQMS